MLPITKLRILAILLPLAITSVSSISSAQTLVGHSESSNMQMLPLTSCAAAIGLRTFQLPGRTPKGFGLALFHISLTAATDMTLQCFSSINRDFVNPKTYAKLQICDNVTSGACKLIDAKFIKTVGAAEELVARIDILGSEDVQCVFSCTTGSFQIWGRMSSL